MIYPKRNYDAEERAVRATVTRACTEANIHLLAISIDRFTGHIRDMFDVLRMHRRRERRREEARRKRMAARKRRGWRT